MASAATKTRPERTLKKSAASAIEGRAFTSAEQLEKWLRTHHAREQELWVRLFKKDSGRKTISLSDCVITAIAWGWIDGRGEGLDEISYLVRLTPRRPKSVWSKINCARAETLIAEGRMQPSGLVHVETARADGRWERAYAGSADMVMPEAFLSALAKNPAAKKAFAALSRRRQFEMYLALQTAKREETRTRRIARYVEELSKT